MLGFSAVYKVFILQQVLFFGSIFWPGSPSAMVRLRSLLLVIALDLVAATLICPSKTTADDVLQEQILGFFLQREEMFF